MNHITSLTPFEFMERYRLLIADADGTIRRCTVPGQPCPNGSGEWELIPEARSWLMQVDWNNYGLGIASNQGGISLGYLSEKDAYQMLCTMVLDCIQRFPPRNSIQICPSMDKNDRNRKPNPGMLNTIMVAYNRQASETLMVGDLESDRQAAANTNCDFIWAWNLFGFEREVTA